MCGAAVAALAACRGPALPAPPRLPDEPPADRKVAALGDLLTSVRLKWWIGLQPDRLWSLPWLRKALTRVLRDDRLALMTQATGIDLARSRELGLAGYRAGPDSPASVVMLARHDADPIEIERRFRTRLTGGEKRTTEGHQLVRVSGVIGEGARAFARIGPDVAGFQWGGNPERGPLRIATLYAGGALGEVPTLRAHPSSAPARPALERAPIALWFPGPFEGLAARGARGLMAAASGAAIVVQPRDDETLAIEVSLLGDYSDDAAEASRLMAAAWKDLSDSPLGALLGLDDPKRDPAVEAGKSTLSLSLALDPQKLFDGLAAMTIDDARTIFATEN